MASNGLQEFRAKSKIDLESFSRKFHTDDLLEYKRRIWTRLEADPLFAKDGENPTLGDYRKVTLDRTLRILDYDLLSQEDVFTNPMRYVRVPNLEFTNCLFPMHQNHY